MAAKTYAQRRQEAQEARVRLMVSRLVTFREMLPQVDDLAFRELKAVVDDESMRRTVADFAARGVEIEY